jgi:magnesium chelatase family protein
MNCSSVRTSDIHGTIIDIECRITQGLPSVHVVGMASKAVDESKERVRAAFEASAIPFPKKKILINLAPADLAKEGSSYDLAIACAILAASGLLPKKPRTVYCYGELSLDGAVKPVRGIVGRLMGISQVIDPADAVFIPVSSAAQARLIDLPLLIPTATLSELLSILQGTSKPNTYALSAAPISTNPDSSFAEVKGQTLAKRALEIAASGKHNVLLYGPPGTGKTMLAKALRSILPDLTPDEMRETTHIHSLASPQFDHVQTTPPIRMPHHGSSEVAILGGGTKVKPGEISMAHNGVLVFDEVPEFTRSCIEALRQPLEDRVINISRASLSVTYPASFIFVATMNPCPCGHLGSERPCSCSALSISQYQKKLSGPILDRIDLFVFVDDIPRIHLLEDVDVSEMIEVKDRIQTARTTQINRNASQLMNSELTNAAIRKLALDADARTLLDTAADKLQLSPRAYFRVLKVARTIADLKSAKSIDKDSIAEAISFRQKPTYT